MMSGLRRAPLKALPLCFFGRGLCHSCVSRNPRTFNFLKHRPWIPVPRIGVRGKLHGNDGAMESGLRRARSRPCLFAFFGLRPRSHIVLTGISYPAQRLVLKRPSLLQVLPFFKLSALETVVQTRHSFHQGAALSRVAQRPPCHRDRWLSSLEQDETQKGKQGHTKGRWNSDLNKTLLRRRFLPSLPQWRLRQAGELQIHTSLPRPDRWPQAEGSPDRPGSPVRSPPGRRRSRCPTPKGAARGRSLRQRGRTGCRRSCRPHRPPDRCTRSRRSPVGPASSWRTLGLSGECCRLSGCSETSTPPAERGRENLRKLIMPA